MKEPRNAGNVEARDDTIHTINYVGNVSVLMEDGKEKYMADVLHVPTITKSLFLVGQMVEHGLQVQFNKHGCFVEDFNNKVRLVAKGNKDGRMFTLDVNMPKSSMARVIAIVAMWHKWIGHVDLQRLKAMQTQEVVIGHPNFKMNDMQNICEACQFGKQSRHAFAKPRNVSERPLQVIHSNEEEKKHKENTDTEEKHEKYDKDENDIEEEDDDDDQDGNEKIEREFLKRKIQKKGVEGSDTPKKSREQENPTRQGRRQRGVSNRM